MADLSVLIRLHKHELDEKRLALSRLYEEAEAQARARRELDRAFEREKEAARNIEEGGFTFSTYAEKVRRRRGEMAQEKLALERRIESAKDSMMETFSELKKYEMTEAERKRLEAEERALKEARQMDEIGLEGFRRKSEE